MPSTPSKLRIHRPTPTTISFTVSTREPLETLTARVLHYVALSIRVLIAAAVLLILWTKWELYYPMSEGNGVPPWVTMSFPGHVASLIAEGVMARYLIPLGGLVLWACARRGYTG
jgi:phosphatidylinositol glycan class H protein